MEQAIAKAETLIEALQFIRRFRDKVTVIKLGGSNMESPESVRATLQDVVFMETVGMRPVIVHGGGAAISAGMKDAGIEPRFVEGRRYTDEASLEIVKRELLKLNDALVEQIEDLGGLSHGVHFASKQALFGSRLTLPGSGNERIDLGFVGKVDRVDTRILDKWCRASVVPVVPCLVQDEQTGDILNVNADTAAAAVAEAMGAEKLMFLSDTDGIWTDRNEPSSRASSLSDNDVRELMANGVIDSGMIPKAEACLDALRSGVRKTHIIDGRVRHSLLLEIYTDTGIGTEIILQQQDRLRRRAD